MEARRRISVRWWAPPSTRTRRREPVPSTCRVERFLRAKQTYEKAKFCWTQGEPRRAGCEVLHHVDREPGAGRKPFESRSPIRRTRNTTAAASACASPWSWARVRRPSRSASWMSSGTNTHDAVRRAHQRLELGLALRLARAPRRADGAGRTVAPDCRCRATRHTLCTAGAQLCTHPVAYSTLTLAHVRSIFTCTAGSAWPLRPCSAVGVILRDKSACSWPLCAFRRRRPAARQTSQPRARCLRESIVQRTRVGRVPCSTLQPGRRPCRRRSGNGSTIKFASTCARRPRPRGSARPFEVAKRWGYAPAHGGTNTDGSYHDWARRRGADRSSS